MEVLYFKDTGKSPLQIYKDFTFLEINCSFRFLLGVVWAINDGNLRPVGLSYLAVSTISDPMLELEGQCGLAQLYNLS